MRTLKTIAIAILAITAIALTTASVFAYMGRPGYYTPDTTSTETPETYSSGTGSYGTYGRGMMGGGMMGGYGYYSAPPVTTVPPQTSTPSTTTPVTPTYPYQYGGCGCGGMRARSSYGAPAYTNPTSASPLDINTAVTIAQNYLASTGNTNLVVSQVEEYTLNFYVMVKEKDTGIGAFELLVDKYTGAISPDMGPNMMWNTKYGMMSGGTTAPATVTAEQAKANAQQYLNTYYSGTTAGDAQAFYGYYHFEVLSSGGNVYGMLSVNSYTGQVWYHTWHGTFIQEIEFG